MMGGLLFLLLRSSYFAVASALPAPEAAYLRRNRSTRPAVSTSFCLPVKKGWQAEQISRTMSPLWVERVSKWWPQAQRALVLSYLGGRPSLGMVNPFVANPPQNGSLARAGDS